MAEVLVSSGHSEVRRWPYLVAMVVAAGAFLAVVGWKLVASAQEGQVQAVSAEHDGGGQALSSTAPELTIVYPSVEPVRVETETLAPDDPLNDALEVGWLPVTRPGEDAIVGFIPTTLYFNAMSGDVLEAVDTEGDRVGYYVLGIGFVEGPHTDLSTLDWAHELRDRAPAGVSAEHVEEQIAGFERLGGLRPVQPAVASG